MQDRTARQFKVIQGSKHSSIPNSRRTIPLKATSTRPLPPLLALYEDRELPPRLLARLKRLDAEQLQIIEVVTAAIERGAI